MDSDSEDDTFVTIGTPLEPYQEEEVPKKPVVIQDQTVRDSKGRQRFHGAFTGGFSAGFFNTVGSKEGFVPSTFVSSREKKQDAATSQKPEDFMDDEDFGEHGIAPKKISTTSDFKSTSEIKRKHQKTETLNVLEKIVIPTSESMGYKLLCHLGWRHGQGIGPRIQKKKKTHESQVKKVYGCSLPEEEDSDEDEFIPDNVTFAPKDVNPIKFTPKDNLHGLGYSGINIGHMQASSQKTSGHVNLFEPLAMEATAGFRTKNSSGKKRNSNIGMRGQAFGVGAYEDEDDMDVYSRDSMDNYDIEISGPRDDKTYGWTAPKHKGLSAAPIGYLGKVLEGFKLSTNTLKPKKHFPPPDLPKTFQPFHVRATEKVLQREPAKVDRRNMDAQVRTSMLGEAGSVMDLVSPSDKAKMEKAKESTSVKFRIKERTPLSRFDSESPTVKKEPVETITSENKSSSTPSTSKSLYQGAAVFKPFASNPAKQARYEQYLKCTKNGGKYKGDDSEELMTEWERTKERNEFARAAQLYKPMSSIMASRFTAAKFDDNEKTVELPPEESAEKNEKEKAVEMKMFGKLTREKYTWYPHKTLCKLFNVANPYPGATIVGVPKIKRDKYSVFNFLTDPTSSEMEVTESTHDGEEETEQLEEQHVIKEEKSQDESKASQKKDINIRPLAILGDGGGEPSTPGSSTDTTHPPTSHVTETDKITQRPSMDIFKAIFSDSDDSSSDESEKDTTGTIGDQNAPSSSGTIAIESLKDRLSPQKAETDEHIFKPSTKTPLNNSFNKTDSANNSESKAQKHVFSLPNKRLVSDNQVSDTINTTADTSQNIIDLTNSNDSVVTPAKLNVSLKDTYEDELQSGALWTEKRVSGAESGDVKAHKRHKHKRKKSSHKSKKRRKSEKKSKKKSRRRSGKKEKKVKKEESSSDESSSSAAEADSSDGDMDARIQERLKTLAALNKRPTADDFM